MPDGARSHRERVLAPTVGKELIWQSTTSPGVGFVDPVWRTRRAGASRFLALARKSEMQFLSVPTLEGG